MTVLGRVARTIETRSVVPPDMIDVQTPGSLTEGSWGPGMVWNASSAFPLAGVNQAMMLSAVFACLRLLSENVATMPLDTFYRSGGVRKPWRPRPEYLNFNPPQGSRIEYLSQVMLSLLTDGNAYVLTPRNALGEVVDLVVLDPTLVHVSRKGGKVVYRCIGVDLDPFVDVMHIKGMTLPGQVKGLSPIGYARETIGLGLNAQRFGSGFFKNNALPSAVIEAQGKFSQQAQDRWVESWTANHGGVDQAQKLGVLTEGAKLTKISISPEDAQFLQTRAFQVPDIARFYGCPPHLIADASNSTSWGSGLAEQNTMFGQMSLRPWCERIEEQHARLLSTEGLPLVFVKFNMDALLRADLMERTQAGALAIQNHMMVVNEWRNGEDMPPVPWGDEPFDLTKITETGPAPLDMPGTGPVGTTIQPPPIVVPPLPPRKTSPNGAQPVGAAK